MMKVRRLTQTDRWDDFVEKSINGTIFHKLRFLNYHPSDRFDFLHLAIVEDDEIVCLIPGGKYKDGEDLIFKSPLGASFGGLVLSDLNLQRNYNAIDALNSWLTSKDFAGAELVFPPLCYWDRWDESIDYILNAKGYRLESVEATSVIDLFSFESGNLKPAFQRNIRRSEKGGVVVRRSQDPTGFYEVLEASLSSKNAIPTHALSEIAHLMETFPEEVVLFEAVLAEKVVGGCLIFNCNRNCALAFYICDDPQYRNLRVTDRVLFECVAWLKGLGHHYFDLGTVSMGGEMNWGLVQFKGKLADLIFGRKKYVIRFGG